MSKPPFKPVIRRPIAATVEDGAAPEPSTKAAGVAAEAAPTPAAIPTLEAWLASRNISLTALKAQDPATAQRWQVLFSQMHPESFATQTKFEINAVRRDVELRIKN